MNAPESCLHPETDAVTLYKLRVYINCLGQLFGVEVVKTSDGRDALVTSHPWVIPNLFLTDWVAVMHVTRTAASS